jgi:hypothetical protein
MSNSNAIWNVTSGQITASNVYVSNSMPTINGNVTIDGYISASVPLTDELPPITMNTHDENGRSVTMTLAPEANISTTDLTKIFMLAMVMMNGRGGVNSLSYVKKHNLERHFKYS